MPITRSKEINSVVSTAKEPQKGTRGKRSSAQEVALPVIAAQKANTSAASSAKSSVDLGVQTESTESIFSLKTIAVMMACALLVGAYFYSANKNCQMNLDQIKLESAEKLGNQASRLQGECADRVGNLTKGCMAEKMDLQRKADTDCKAAITLMSRIINCTIIEGSYAGKPVNISAQAENAMKHIKDLN
ncbi:MAG: hypothetical protein FJZ63_04315 [Chlamydiae bacterium]|nr:hypothetical protein [Chlamydiota bacterium]